MTKHSSMLWLFAGAAAFFSIADSGALAGSSGQGTVQAPERSGLAPLDENPVPPGGAQHSPMPLATEDLFEKADPHAPKRAPTGKPGVSN